jgi:hypothetical protein
MINQLNLNQKTTDNEFFVSKNFLNECTLGVEVGEVAVA